MVIHLIKFLFSYLFLLTFPFYSGLAFSQVGGLGQYQGVGGGMQAGVLGSGLPPPQTSPTTILAAPTVIKNIDPLPPQPAISNPLSQNIEALKPNEFQKYVLQTTGNKLPVHGLSFFENSQGQRNQAINSSQTLNSAFEMAGTSSVSGDYPIGPGDQLVIRGWGSLEIDVRALVDRNGYINIPKIGSIYLAGVKFSQIEGVIKSAFNKYYKDFQISVAMGQLRTINVSVVGQARRPGSYSLSSTSTLANAFLVSGGPNHIGSLRRAELKRGGKSIAEFDLYEFLAKGSSTGEVKLIEGDVIFIPQAYGYAAVTGKVNNSAIFELKSSNEKLEYLLSLAGGLSINADPRKIYIDSLNPAQKPLRTISEYYLDNIGLQTIIKNSDIVEIQAVTSEIPNTITLRGKVAQSKRVPWRPGFRISDLITNKELLISKESLRRQSEVLFDVNQRERTQRERENIPEDLLDDPIYDSRIDQRVIKELKAKNTVLSDINYNTNIPASSNILSTNQNNNRPSELRPGVINNDNSRSIEAFREARSARLFSNQDPLKINERNNVPTVTDLIGNVFEDINWDYAVIERLDRKNLNTILIPFNLGLVLNNEMEPENYLLEPGDVVTIFSATDFRVPITKRRVIVRIEGEVARPGIYQVLPSENLSDLLRLAGGLTHEAYLYGAAFYREEVRKSQAENLEKLLRRLESELSGQLAQASQSLGAGSDATLNQARILSAQQAQKQALERIRNLRPEGRISLGLEPQYLNFTNNLPKIRMQNGDRFYIPPRPDFVYVYGAVNTESALIYREGKTVKDYLQLGGVSSGADRDSVILIRADGSALTRSTEWFGSINNIRVMPGDSIVMPEKLDREASWSAIVRNAKDITQIFYQLGLGAAGLKALGY